MRPYIFKKENLILFLTLIIPIIFISFKAKATILIDSDTIANIAERTSNTVVNIESSKKTKEPEVREPKNLNLGGIEITIPRITPQPQSGTGSGIIIQSDGYILTNYHVIKDSDLITVTFKDGEKLNAKEIAHDNYSDIAVIKVEKKNLPIAHTGKSETLRTGDWVIAIGSPLGLEHTVTHGIISALSRHVGVTFGAAQGAFKYIQTDAAINPGNSGGPLLNLNGEVIGINTFIIGHNAQNLNFSIPADYAINVAEGLIKNGSIKHPYLGIKMALVTEEQLKSEGLPKDTVGVYVVETIVGSPAHSSGILPGDIIQKINGIDITEPTKVAEIVRDKKVGDKLHLRILKGSKAKIITVEVGTLPEGDSSEK